MQEKIKCLYYIKDNRTDKIIYIGQTKDFLTRKCKHFYQKDRPIDKHIQEDGKENFTMLPFENIDCLNLSDEELRNKEDELILYYNTIEDGYNKRRSGDITKQENYFKIQSYNYYHTSEKRREYYKQYNKEHHEKLAEYQRNCRLRKKLNITNKY